MGAPRGGAWLVTESAAFHLAAQFRDALGNKIAALPVLGIRCSHRRRAYGHFVNLRPFHQSGGKSGNQCIAAPNLTHEPDRRRLHEERFFVSRDKNPLASSRDDQGELPLKTTRRYSPAMSTTRS